MALAKRSTWKQRCSVVGDPYSGGCQLPNDLGTSETLRRLAEFVLFYVGVPMLVARAPRAALMPTLWLAGLLVYRALRRSQTFDRRHLTVWSGWSQEWRAMLGRFSVAALLLVGVLWWHRPELLFRLPRQHPILWVLIVVFYPLISVYPQALIYRALYRHRYAPVFASLGLEQVVGALVFSLAHLPFANGWALVFTLVGGLIFLRTYERTGSLWLSCMEHGLYGNLLFTVGWGTYLYRGGTQWLFVR